jgi:hypothetical protein
LAVAVQVVLQGMEQTVEVLVVVILCLALLHAQVAVEAVMEINLVLVMG